MKRVAEDVWMLSGFPPNAINVYLAGDVLVDAGTRFAARRILRQVRGRPIAAHALTHAHPDHRGSSHTLCQTLGLPLWCGTADVAVVEGRPAGPPSRRRGPSVTVALERFWSGPSHPVARVLSEGDEIAGFRVLDAPGHSPGHVALWREHDRVLIAGDVLNGQHLLTGLPGLHEPPGVLSHDPALNRRSIRRLAALSPAVVLFGHGPPWRDPDGLAAFAAGLPD